MKKEYKKSDFIEIRRERVFSCPACRNVMPEPRHSVYTECMYCKQEMVSYGNELTLFYTGGNVTRVLGQPLIRYIGEMIAGDSGYALPNAYDAKANTLNEHNRIMPKKNERATMFVDCIKTGVYEVLFLKSDPPQFHKGANVCAVTGRPTRHCIGDMLQGESGYAMPCAYDTRTKMLNERHRIVDEKSRAETMLVECVVKGEYKISF